MKKIIIFTIFIPLLIFTIYFLFTKSLYKTIQKNIFNSDKNLKMKMKNQKIAILYGTNRTNSLTEQVGKYYVKLLNEKGIKALIIDLKNLPDDFTKTALYENNGKNNKFNKLKKIINESEKIVIITPEYNGSFPGVLKAFIDGLEFPKSLKGKKCALVGVSKGRKGCLLGISHLTDILNHLGTYVLPLKVSINSITKPEIDSVIKNENNKKAINEQIALLIKY